MIWPSIHRLLRKLVAESMICKEFDPQCGRDWWGRISEATGFAVKL
jgi:hypothetical protein